MKLEKRLKEILGPYEEGKVTIGVIGSHSALDICLGAKEESLANVVVCQRGREMTYAHHYRSRKVSDLEVGIVDHVVLLDRFSDVLREDVQSRLRDMRTVFVPNRSFAVYVPYDGIEQDFLVPIFGNRYLLRAEERYTERNQYSLLEKAAIRTPRRFSRHDEIDRLCIVKVPEAQRQYERGFFLASSPSDFERKSAKLADKGLISADSLGRATIEEFLLGAHFNFNFFYSPLTGELELLGVDTRRQTNLDGILRLPASEQLAIMDREDVKSIEIGHFACTVRESLLEQAFELGERFVRVARSEYPPGIIGPFALQCMITPGPPHEEIVVFDASLRMPGSPGTKFTPYSEYLWRRSISFGRRIAMEVRRAIQESRLAEVVT